MAIDPPRRPGDLDRLDPVGPAEPEVEARIGGGEVAAAPDALGDLATASRHVTVTRAPTPSRLEAAPSRRRVREWPPAVRLWK